jgi:serine/threonine protein phosphatase 1
MRTLAIGDIHGCNSSLVELLKQVRLEPDDQVIFLGDYIDRGPASRQVVESLLELKKGCSPFFLRGNHEVMILEAREDPVKSHLWESYGGLETAFSYGANFREDWASTIPVTHWTFLEQTMKFLETDTHIFVHACLDPGLDMIDQPDWLLYWEYFERLQPHKSNKRIVCGHTPQKSGQIKDVGFAVCIDTGPAVGGWLTCLDTSSGKFWQANEKGETRDGAI